MGVGCVSGGMELLPLHTLKDVSLTAFNRGSWDIPDVFIQEESFKSL